MRQTITGQERRYAMVDKLSDAELVFVCPCRVFSSGSIDVDYQSGIFCAPLDLPGGISTKELLHA